MSGEPICFECDAKDGLKVRLTQDRWDNHIRLVDGHAELEWHFAYPKSEIRKALELARRDLARKQARYAALSWSARGA